MADQLRWRARFALLAMLALATTSLGLLDTTPADSSLRAVTASRGQSSLATGFLDGRFTSQESSVRIQALERATALGSRLVRVNAYWANIAPTFLPSGFNGGNPGDPHYNWSSLDGAVRDATSARQTILLTLLDAPTWAEESPPRGALQGAWRPSPAALGAFAHAAAARYSGAFPDPSRPGAMLPRVSYFQVWNEPNLPKYLEPEWARTSGGSIVPVAPAFYRQMVNSAYSNIKSVQPSASVILAGLAPYGNLPGGPRMTPVTFLSELLCLHGSQLRPESCRNPTHFDGFDHHPYGATPTASARNALDVALPNLGRLQRIVAVAERTRRAVPAGRKPMWVTEWAFGSSPPNRGSNPLARQARYLSLGLFELWRQGVRYTTWVGLFDDPAGDLGFTGTGVYFVNGRAKPSAAAFDFPFVAVPNGGGNVTIWGLSRVRGTVTIQRQTSGGWRQVAQLPSRPGGIFYGQRRLGSHLVLRATADGRSSPPYASG